MLTDPTKIPSPVYIKAAALWFGVTPEDIMGHRRTPMIVRARFAACHLLHKQRRSAYKAIARVLERDHSTIICAVRRGESLLSHDAHFIERYRAAERDALSWARGEPLTAKVPMEAIEPPKILKQPSAVNFEALASHEPENIENKMMRESMARASVKLGRLLSMERAGQ